MNNDRQIVIIGGGGHGLSILSALRDSGHNHIAYVNYVHSIKGLKHLGPDSEYLKSLPNGNLHFCAVGENQNRKRIQELYERKGAEFMNVIHPRSFIEEEVELGLGIFIGAFAYINRKVSIKDGCIINNHGNIEHDCRIDEFVHIGPSTCLTGNVWVGEQSLIGAGSTIIPGVKIGRESIVGAGTVVLKNIGDRIKVAGNPAKIL